VATMAVPGWVADLVDAERVVLGTDARRGGCCFLDVAPLAMQAAYHKRAMKRTLFRGRILGCNRR
jgi:hypothetical protein